MKTRKLSRVLLVMAVVAVLAVVLAVSSLAAIENISGGDGKLEGIVDGASYEIAEVTINAAGDGLTVGSWTALEENSGLAGLYYVREAGADTQSGLVYVSGDVTDRQMLGELITTGAGYASSKYLSTDKNTTDFVSGTWTGIVGHYSAWDAYRIGSTGGEHLSATLAETLKDAADDDAKAAAQQAIVDELAKDKSLRYAYTPDEIIPIGDVKTFSFAYALKRQGGIVYSGKLAVQFKVYIADLDGNVTTRTYTSAENAADDTTRKLAVDFTSADSWDAAMPAEGYVVGIQILPWYAKDGFTASDFTANGTSATMPDIRIMPAGYVIEFPAMAEEISGGKGKLEGIVDGASYEIAEVTINAAGDGLTVGSWTALEENSGLAGLYYVRRAYAQDYNTDVISEYVVDATFYSQPSDLIYVSGSYAERQELGEKVTYTSSATSTNGQTLTRWDFEKTSTPVFVAGKYSSIENATNDVFPEYQFSFTSGLPKAKAETLKEAQDALAAATEENRAAAEEAVLTAQKDIADWLATHDWGIRYGYLPEEIIPVSELESFTFTTAGRQTSVIYPNIASRVELYVATPEGEVETYAYTTAEKAYTDTSATYTVDFTSNSGWDKELPEDGWAVGLNIIQWYPGEAGWNASLFEATGTGTTMPKIIIKAGSYEIIVPELPPRSAPTGLSLDEDNNIIGLSADESYEYARVTVAGIGEYTAAAEGAVQIEAPGVGLWAVRTLGDYITCGASIPTVLYIAGTPEEQKDFGTLVEVTNGTNTHEQYAASNTNSWMQGVWTGADNGNHYAWGKYQISTSGGHVNADPYAKNLYNAKNNIADSTTGVVPDLAAAKQAVVEDAATVVFKYAYENNEIVSVNDIVSVGFTVDRRVSNIDFGNVQSIVTFYVADANGNIKGYDWVSEEFAMTTAPAFSAVPSDIANWPESGWVVGFEIKPWCNASADYDMSIDRADHNTIAIITLDPEDYTLRADCVTETPDLSRSEGLITVNNYDEHLEYQYSVDNATWTTFTGGSFAPTEANTTYYVKSLANDFYDESEVAEIVSPAVVLRGVSLVLDGQIGIKVYIDADRDAIKDIQLYMSMKNDDYEINTDNTWNDYQKQAGINFSQNTQWATAITLDEATGLYYTILYIPAKDLDNIFFETDLGYWSIDDPDKTTRIKVGNPRITFKNYIEDAKVRAAAGEAEFVEAESLINALEVYAAYADNYFGEGEDAAYATTNTIEAPDATRSGAIAGIEFYGTTLVLENTVAFRHYFYLSEGASLDGYTAWVGEDKVDIVAKDSFVYCEISDISAQNIGDAFTLTIKDANDVAAYTVIYSVANYIKNQASSDNANLASLVNAMYDYYIEAKAYANK